MISNEAHQTLRMLRVKVKPITVAAPTKRPTGGRPNPVAEHVTPERRTYPCITRQTRAASVQTAHPNDFCARFVAAVQSGKIPIGIEITGRDLRRTIGNNFNGGWENVATTLAANNDAVRIVTVNRKGSNRPVYRIELR